MARLAHNDYLEQASDSGLPGFLVYTVFIVSALVWTFPRQGRPPSTGAQDWLVFAIWLGVLEWSLQGLVEFGLYIPALAWPAFGFLGWLLARRAGSRPAEG
jgi:O-antigen ligase